MSVWQWIACGALTFSAAVLAWALVRRGSGQGRGDLAAWMLDSDPGKWEGKARLFKWGFEHQNGLRLERDYGYPWRRLKETSTGRRLGLFESLRVARAIEEIKRRQIRARIGSGGKP